MPPTWMTFLWILVIWLIISILFQSYQPPAPQELAYTDFKKAVNHKKVDKVTIKGHAISGEFREKAVKSRDSGKKGSRLYSRSDFKTRIPAIGDPELLQLLEKNGVSVSVESDEPAWFVTILVNLLPWILIIGLFFYFSRRMQERMSSGGGPFGVGKSKAKIYKKTESDLRLDDVAGLANAKKEVQEIIDYLKDPAKFHELGGKLPRGVLLAGPPGTGKTLLARATAGEANVPFFSISGSEFIEMFVGVGASRVRNMFDDAKKETPSIIFIDEIDAIGRVRGTGLGGGHDEREQTLNQILSEMDGFSGREAVVVMAATNRSDVLDPALTRPGRFDRQIILELPHKNARKQILEIHTRNMPLAEDVNLEIVARRTVGFAGADLENLANESALFAARNNRKKIIAEDFDESLDKITLGLVRDELINEEDRKIVAYHEVGHAMMAKLLPGTDPLEKVTIIPHGQALGATQQIPEEDRYNLSRQYLQSRIGVMLGGRVAEKIFFGDITSGAANDLKQATELARRMVCQFGMSDRLGPVNFPQGDRHPFLGQELTEPKNYSERTAYLIDKEVYRIITEMEDKVVQLISDKQEEIKIVVSELLEKETLSNKEIDAIIAEQDSSVNSEKQEQQ
ncbi:MAG: ATP-dependent zinc metalloprotease FtsH [Desulfobia sp.]